MVELHRLDGENEEQFIWRLGRAKDSGELDMEWDDVAHIINKEFRADDSEYREQSAYRKPYQSARKFYEAGCFNDLTSEKYLAILQNEKNEIKKERQKLMDERTDYQRSIREQSRKESFIDLVERTLAKNIEPLEGRAAPYIDNDDDMIVCLSDLHTGIEVDNWWNSYNTSILKERLNVYIGEIKKIQAIHHCKYCELVLGGDNISGNIHYNLRLQNNENVIEQLKIAITYIGQFIDAIQDLFEEVRVHSVSGNHSRVTPNKDEHLSGEELDAMIPFCLKIQFKNSRNIVICDDMIDNTICSFQTRGGKLFYLVHGDKDNPSNVVKNLTLMTGKKPDAVLMAHRHHNAYDSQHGVKVVQMGCVVGTDDHCVDLRISGKPEQCIIITNGNSAIKCLYDVALN